MRPLALALLLGVSEGKAATGGFVVGRVCDPSGGGVAGADVQLVDSAGEDARAAAARESRADLQPLRR